MFAKSAATTSLQSKAIHAANEKWNVHADAWKGRETIGIPVCKKKYAPFDIKVRSVVDGQVKVTVERMYGCVCHSNLRKKVIEENGERNGWEPFGQWSMSKARRSVRREICRIVSPSDDSSSSSSGSDDSSDSELEDYYGSDWKAVCHDGQCAWKMKGKFDNVRDEIREGDNEASMYLDEAALKNGAGINGALLRGALPGGGG